MNRRVFPFRRKLVFSASLSGSVDRMLANVANAFPVLFQNPELVVMNKPFDVAMDGERPDESEWTVDKWLRNVYLKQPFPFRTDFRAAMMSSSALLDKQVDEDCACRDSSAIENSCCTKESKSLEEDTSSHEKQRVISRDSRSPKYVHQLDYATSGLLCVAFSKDMASRLAHCFEMRSTEKFYLALVLGHVKTEDLLAMQHPVAAVKRTGNLCDPSESRLVCGEGWTVRSLSAAATLSGEAESFPQGRVISSDALADSWWNDCVNTVNQSNSTSTGSISGASLEWLEVSFHVGYDDDDANHFRMCVNGSASRSAVTRLRVLERGTAQVQVASCSNASDSSLPIPTGLVEVPVTKLLLYPKTGRRHQLRVTCASLGHPIVGDAAYVLPFAGMGAPPPPSYQELEWSRMMLHAWRLAFPVSIACRSDVEKRNDKLRRKQEMREARRQRRRVEGSEQTEGDSICSPVSDVSFSESAETTLKEGCGNESEEVVWTKFQSDDPFNGIMQPSSSR